MNLPELQNIRIFQKLGRVDAKSLASCDQLLLILPAKPAASLFKQVPEGAKLQQALKNSAPDSTPAFTTRLSNARQTRLIAGTIKKDASAFEQLSLGRKLVDAARDQKAGASASASSDSRLQSKQACTRIRSLQRSRRPSVCPPTKATRRCL